MTYGAVSINNFIGRASILKRIARVFCANDFSNKIVLNLYGRSGIGKSYICGYIRDVVEYLVDYDKVLIDFNQQKTRSIPDLLSLISQELGFEYFEGTIGLLARYYSSIDSNKPLLYNELVNCFIQEINNVAKIKPVLVILDTIEAVYKKGEWLRIASIIHKTNNRVCFICVGTTKMDLIDRCFDLDIIGFSSEEIKEFFFRRVNDKSFKKEMKKPTSLLPERISGFTQNGHPILCGLLSDWLNEFPDQISYVLGGSKDITENQIILSWVNDATSDLSRALRIMSYFTKRFTIDIACKLLDKDRKTAESIIGKIGDLSFVKYRRLNRY